MIEQDPFEEFKGKFYDQQTRLPNIDSRVQSLLDRYQQELIFEAVLRGSNFEKASLPYVLAYRLHSLKETYSSIGASLGVIDTTIRKIYSFYHIPPVPRGERTRNMWEKTGMKKNISSKVQDWAIRQAEEKRRSAISREEVAKRSGAAARYLQVLQEQGVTSQDLLTAFVEDMEKSGLVFPARVPTVLNEIIGQQEDELLTQGSFSYQPSKRQLAIMEKTGSRTLVLKSPQAIIFELLLRNFGQMVPVEISLQAIGANNDRDRGLGQLRTIVNRLRNELKSLNIQESRFDSWVHTIAGKGHKLIDPKDLENELF